ncbi:fasciclin domain-containing protein [Nonlabens xiamenensis]|uniref:fasciclin domain-containing protein n=1 Tax=Nonlabens xiamenensis TaxID=2341043 RepID=UPI000F606028|nr:fasciclin domain-containing protein [Nonlabens xiamenensis]
MKKFLLIFSCLVVTLCLFSCEDADDNGNLLPSDNMAYDIIAEDPNLSVLKEVLDLTGLDATLDNPNQLTVFAPTNAAFNQFLTANGYATIQEVPIGMLRDILRYHQLNGVFTTELLTTGFVKTLGTDGQGELMDLYFASDAGITLNGYATVDPQNNDITVDNGVIHLLDAVLELPTLDQFVAANATEFSNLNTALVQQGLDNSLATTDGSMQGPFTLFAPTNDAFQALIDEDPMDGLNSIQDVLDLTTLTDILLYHVKPSPRLRSSDITDGIIIDPIAPGTFLINTSTGTVITDASGRAINITSTDVTASNGILHYIDLVMLP